MPQQFVPPLGHSEETRYFFTTYPKAADALDRLYDTCEKVFIRSSESDKPSERLGFFLGRICVEEFSELVLLAVNGYGIGALKILRTMYERAVHAAYLFNHPELADLFLNYNTVHKRKAHNHLKKIFGVGTVLPPKDAQALEDDFKTIELDYTEVVCATCGTKRVQGSWTKLDLGSMANDVDDGYAELYYDCYYKPTLQTHTTVASLEARMSVVDGVLTFNDGPQRDQARTAIVHGHNLLLKVLETQNSYFQLGEESVLMERQKEFISAYAASSIPVSPPPPSSESAGQ